MQTDAADASKSKQKLRHWIKKLQINKKTNRESQECKDHDVEHCFNVKNLASSTTGYR